MFVTFSRCVYINLNACNYWIANQYYQLYLTGGCCTRVCIHIQCDLFSLCIFIFSPQLNCLIEKKKLRFSFQSSSHTTNWEIHKKQMCYHSSWWHRIPWIAFDIGIFNKQTKKCEWKGKYSRIDDINIWLYSIRYNFAVSTACALH